MTKRSLSVEGRTPRRQARAAEDLDLAARQAEDPELWEEVAAGAPRRLLVAGLECFASHGFHATTTRDISQRAGMSPAAMYVHYASKSELLYRVSRIGHEAALRTLSQSVAGVDEPRERMRSLVTEFASWHARNHRLARVVQYELDALPPEGYDVVRGLRRQSAEIVEEEIARGLDAGAFDTADLGSSALAVLSLCIDVARWYVPGRSPPYQELAPAYAELVLRMLGAERGSSPLPAGVQR